MSKQWNPSPWLVRVVKDYAMRKNTTVDAAWVSVKQKDIEMADRHLEFLSRNEKDNASDIQMWQKVRDSAEELLRTRPWETQNYDVLS